MSNPPSPGPCYELGPMAEAAEHGITVRAEKLGTVHSVWIPDLATIVLDAGLTPTLARYAVMHQLVHAEFDHLGIMGSLMDEETVCIAVARRMMPKKALRWALEQTDDAEQVAELLEVPVNALRRRLSSLTSIEQQRLDSLVYRLYWAPSAGESEGGYRCGRVDDVADLQNPAVDGYYPSWMPIPGT